MKGDKANNLFRPLLTCSLVFTVLFLQELGKLPKETRFMASNSKSKRRTRKPVALDATFSRSVAPQSLALKRDVVDGVLVVSGNQIKENRLGLVELARPDCDRKLSTAFADKGQNENNASNDHEK